MKDNYKIGSNSKTDHAFLSLRRLQLVCGQCYQAILRRLAATRATIERKFGRNTPGYEHVIRAAVNEAEALAWQTPYPHLVFPALAEEKALAVQQWAAHQREVRAREEVLAFAA